MYFLDFTTANIADARLIKCEINWMRNIKKRPYHGLLYVKNGCFDVIKSHTKTTIVKDNILFIEKGSNYKIVSTETSELIVLSFDEPALSILCEKQLVKVEKNNIIVKLLTDLIETFMEISPTYKIKCKSIFYNLAINIINKYRYHKESAATDRLLFTLNYINDYYFQKISISELAKSTYLSDTHYRRLFKQHYGLPPSDYLNIFRINKAKEFINSNTYTFSKIAALTGFCDLYHFSRVFKKHTGMAPTAYKTFS